MAELTPVGAARLVADAAIKSLRAALEPVLDWYQSDEQPPRPLPDIVRDVVTDLQKDRTELLRLEKESHWISTDTALPDEDLTVLVYAPDADEPVWLGYLSEGLWYCADGMPLAVTHWRDLPCGPEVG